MKPKQRYALAGVAGYDEFKSVRIYIHTHTNLHLTARLQIQSNQITSSLQSDPVAPFPPQLPIPNAILTY